MAVTALYNKFNDFTEQLMSAVHNLESAPAGDTLKAMLTNTAPVATNTVKANITEISAGNGYTAGGATITYSVGETDGTTGLFWSNVIWTASGGNIGPFRYVVIYNDTPTSPADPLIGWFDYGSSVTLLNGDTFTVAQAGALFNLT